MSLKASLWILARPRPPALTPPPARIPTSSWPSNCPHERRRRRRGGKRKRRRSWRGSCNSRLRKSEKKKRDRETEDWQKGKSCFLFCTLRSLQRHVTSSCVSPINCIMYRSVTHPVIRSILTWRTHFNSQSKDHRSFLTLTLPVIILTSLTWWCCCCVFWAA